MAGPVIYTQGQDFMPLAQLFAQVIGKVSQKLQDQAAVNRTARASGLTPQGQSPGAGQEQVVPGSTAISSSSAGANPGTGGQPAGQIDTGLGGATQTPDFAAMAKAAAGNPAAQQYIKGVQEGFQAQRENEVLKLEQKKAATAEMRAQAAAAAAQANAQERVRHNLVGEGQRQQGLAQGEQRIGIEKDKAEMEQEKFPLVMSRLKTGLAKDQMTLKNLQQQQSSILAPDELQKMAENYAATGFKSPPNFGWGASGPASINRMGFWRAVNNLPLSADDRRQAQIGYHMQQQEASVAGRTLANLNININKADQLMKPIEASLKQLEPSLSKSPMMNRFKRAVMTGVGDPAFAGADIYVRSFLVSYGKALNPNGVLSVHFDEEVGQMLDTVSSPAQLTAKLNAIRTDMGLEQQAVIAGRSDVLRQGAHFGIMSEPPPGVASAPSEGSAKPQGVDIGKMATGDRRAALVDAKKNGSVVIGPDGTPRRWNPKTSSWDLADVSASGAAAADPGPGEEEPDDESE